MFLCILFFVIHFFIEIFTILKCLTSTIEVLICNGTFAKEDPIQCDVFLTEFVRLHRCLRVLSLNECKCSFTNFFDHLRGNKVLQELYLKNNEMGDEKIAELALALRENSSLQLISLERNNMSIASFQFLAKAIALNKYDASSIQLLIHF